MTLFEGTRFKFISGNFIDGGSFSLRLCVSTGDPFKSGDHWDQMKMIGISDGLIFAIKSDGCCLAIPITSVKFFSGAEAQP